MCVNIIYVCICLYCVICLILYYRSLLICTNKEFMNSVLNFSWEHASNPVAIKRADTMLCYYCHIKEEHFKMF